MKRGFLLVDDKKDDEHGLSSLAQFEQYDAMIASRRVQKSFSFFPTLCWRDADSLNGRASHSSSGHVHGLSCKAMSLLKNKELVASIMTPSTGRWCALCVKKHNAMAERRRDRSTRESFAFFRSYIIARLRDAGGLGSLPCEVAEMIHAYLLAPLFPALTYESRCGPL